MDLSERTINFLWSINPSYEQGDNLAGYYINPHLAARTPGLGRDHVGYTIEIWEDLNTGNKLYRIADPCAA